MQRQEHQTKRIEGYSLTLILNEQKLIIRANSTQSGDLYVCQFRRGQLPNDVKAFFQNQEIFVDVLLADPQKGLRVDQGRLILPYSYPRLNRPVKREFIIPLIKVEANEIQALKKEVASLKVEAKQIPQLKEQLILQQQMLQHLERRSGIYFYNPGPFRQLALDAQNNQSYKIHGNYLIRRPSQENQNAYGFGQSTFTNDMLSLSLISNEPIGQDIRHFSFKIAITDSPIPKFRAFIGLCTKIPEGVLNQNKNKFKFIVPKGTPQQLQKEGLLYQTVKKSFCNLYYEDNLVYPDTLKVEMKKGDTLILTVDLDNCHLTWYRNEVSLERSYFENPLTNIYPFVYLPHNVEANF